MEGDELGPPTPGQVGKRDDGGVAHAGGALVGPTYGEEGGELASVHVPAGGEPAAGDGAQVDGSQVVLGGDHSEAPGGLERAAERG